MTDSDKQILELIDQGGYTQAQQLLSKKIQKFPQRSYYYALQNQVLLKMGKKDQALEATHNLLKKVPSDPQTLSIIYDTYMELGQENDANLAYEQVIKRFPTSETLTLEWFDKSIDKLDLRQWNKIFVYLSKNSSSRLYKFWNAFTYLMLIEKQLATEKEDQLFKMLGLRMIEELTPFENCQELYVYVSFLALNGQSDKVIEVITSTSLNLDLDLMVKYRQILYDSNHWVELLEYTKEILFVQKLDDFTSWKYFIEAGKSLDISRDEMQSYFKLDTRNCSLALIELALVYGLDPEPAFTNYYEKFNHKLCCVNDLKGYLSNINHEKFQILVDKSSEQILSSNPSSPKDLTRLINNQKFVYILGTDDVDTFLSTNWMIYNIYKDNKDIRGGEFDNNPLNELTIISIILDLQKDQSSKNVIKNIAIIYKLLETDKFNHKLKLWLMKLFSRLNTGNLISYHYDKLKIRMLQHESLAHYLKNVNPSKDNLTLFVDIYRFYMTANEEIRSCILTGFNKGTFNKLASFIDLGDKLTHSLTAKFICLNILKFSLILNDHAYVNYFVRDLITNAKTENFIDNCDVTSEWKLGIFEKPLEMFEKNLEEIDIKLWTLRYLIMFTEDSQYFKQYNKIVSSYKLKSPFDNLMNQVYLNIFKLFIHRNDKEIDGLTNYLIKNLKFAKLKPTLIGNDILSSQVNNNIISFVEMSRVMGVLAKKHRQVNFAPLKSVLDQTVMDLKAYNPKEQQLTELSKMETMKIEYVDTNIDATLSLLSTSIEESWLKNI
jgi:N-terminal acetyltransferase B complex non-catalytic subunit